jgi:hypothetical protein
MCSHCLVALGRLRSSLSIKFRFNACVRPRSDTLRYRVTSLDQSRIYAQGVRLAQVTRGPTPTLLRPQGLFGHDPQRYPIASFKNIFGEARVDRANLFR